MRAMFALLFVLALMAPCMAASLEKQILPEDPLAGANVFVEKHCSECHSIRTNDLSNRLGPNLSSIHLRGSLLDVGGILWNHAPNMMQKMAESRIRVPQFTSKEMANLISFLTAYQYYLQEVGKSADPARGESVWKTRCLPCHSFIEDWSKAGPNLSRYRGVSAIHMAQAMWNHGPEMAKTMASKQVPLPQFSGTEMLDLIAYIRSQVPAESEETYIRPGNPNRGAVLFVQKRCTSCHPVLGEGGGGAPDLGRQKELLQDVPHVAGLMWNHSAKMWQEMQRKAIPIPKFTGEEMADIIAYLYLINYYDKPGDPARGEKLFAQKTCDACHHLTGSAGIGPNLAQAQNLDSSVEVVAAMWNHIPQMSKKMQEVGLSWPRINPGEMNDLIAYLLKSRASVQADQHQ
jgi:cytochrome c2